MEPRLVLAAALSKRHHEAHRIVKARQAGEGWSAIARTLNADGIPTAHGGTEWYPSTVRAVATR